MAFILKYGLWFVSAIELSSKGSTVMVFTDADAKDENRQGEVTAAALAKNIKITPVLTGKCSGRKRRETPGMNFR